MLETLAKKVWPDNDVMQRKWIAAVAKARLSPKGWLNDVQSDSALKNGESNAK
jgi:hypothetical protein